MQPKGDRDGDRDREGPDDREQDDRPGQFAGEMSPGISGTGRRLPAAATRARCHRPSRGRRACDLSLLGLLFAWIIGFITHVDSTLYFAQQTDGTEGDRLYFSFTVLTTIGFGDISAVTPVGRALAVIEMLAGQLYLVTVIGLLVGNFVGRQTTRSSLTP